MAYCVPERHAFPADELGRWLQFEDWHWDPTIWAPLLDLSRQFRDAGSAQDVARATELADQIARGVLAQMDWLRLRDPAPCYRIEYEGVFTYLSQFAYGFLISADGLRQGRSDLLQEALTTFDDLEQTALGHGARSPVTSCDQLSSSFPRPTP